MKTELNRMGRIRLFPLLFQNGCSQSSRFLPQARRIVGSGDENALGQQFARFFLAVFFGVTHDGLSEKGTACSVGGGGDRGREPGRIGGGRGTGGGREKGGKWEI